MLYDIKLYTGVDAITVVVFFTTNRIFIIFLILHFSGGLIFQNYLNKCIQDFR